MMSKIVNSSWKEICLQELFTVELSDGDIKIDDCDNGQIPLVSSGATNNGVVGYISENGDGISKVFSGNKITLDMFCNAFYQPDDFFAVSHGRVNILTPLFEMNKYIGLFIATIINNEQHKYSYGRAVYSDEASRMVIKLPFIDDHPDFNYMEDYVKKLWGGKHQSQIGSSELSIDVNSWKEYKIGNLFSLERCKCGNAGDLDSDNQQTIYVGAKKKQNGFMKKVNLYEELMTKGNCIIFICDGEGSVGYTNYMERDFIGSTTLTVGYNQRLNKYNGMFLVSVLDKEKIRYSYGRKYSNTLKSTLIKLPTKDNEPDWDYMEKFIKKLKFSDLI